MSWRAVICQKYIAFTKLGSFTFKSLDGGGVVKNYGNTLRLSQKVIETKTKLSY